MTEDIVSEAIRLLVQGGAPVWVVVALALVVAVVVVVARRVGRLPPPPPEVPAPPAEWNTDPSQGAVVVPNDTPGTRGGQDGTDGG